MKANVSSRVAAFIIDYFVFSLISSVVLSLMSGKNGVVFIFLAILVLYVFYFSATEYAFGCTLGKFICGIRVVKIDGGEVSFLQALSRRFFDCIDFMGGGLVAFILVMVSRDKQRVGDMVAKTYVINKDTEKILMQSVKNIVRE